MAAIVQVFLALLRSHGAHVARHAKAMALWGALLAGFALMAVVFGVILAVHLLGLWLGTTAALALVFTGALLGLVLAALMLRRRRSLLVRAHREHVEQERLAAQAAAAEMAGVYKVSAGLAGVSASIAAIMLMILRRLTSTGGEAPPAGDPPGGAPRDGAPPAAP